MREEREEISFLESKYVIRWETKRALSVFVGTSNKNTALEEEGDLGENEQNSGTENWIKAEMHQEQWDAQRNIKCKCSILQP